MSNFGLPYMGSKDKIAKSIALNFPAAENFYDLFGGGFSMTHYMAEQKKHRYKYFHYNEIKSDIVELVKKAINGDYNYDKFKPEWISREEFFARLDDPYVRICWSFGNNQKYYMFGDIEPYKKSMHMAVVFEEFDEIAEQTLGFKKWPAIAKTIKQRRFYLRQKIEHYRKTKIPKHLHKFLNEKRLQQLERLQQLQQLERLENNDTISFYSKDYREIPIRENSIIYCDIPYKGTADYIGAFNHKDFYDWAMTRNFPVYVSEYNIDDPRFKLVYEVDKRSMLSAEKSNKQMSEKLYWNGVSL